MTAKEKLRERVETLSEDEAERTLRMLDELGDPLGALLARAPDDDEPTTSEEDEGAGAARAEIARGDVYSAEQIKREIA
jgi:hypothetical protein